MYLEFSVPVVPSFLKYDFSDLPALIAAFGVGPLAGVAVELIKNLIHLPMTATGGVGELANFIRHYSGGEYALARVADGQPAVYPGQGAGQCGLYLCSV